MKSRFLSILFSAAILAVCSHAMAAEQSSDAKGNTKKSDQVMLNPQPEPPGVATNVKKAGALKQRQESSAVKGDVKKSGQVMLNPQPEPPGVTMNLKKVNDTLKLNPQPEPPGAK
jgi:hypothetical protein